MVDAGGDYVAINTETLVSLLYYKKQFGTTPELITAPKKVIEEILKKNVDDERASTISVLPLSSETVQKFITQTQFGTIHVNSCKEYENLC